MLSLAHGTTGALLAVKLGHPLLFIPACIAMHYLQDWTPHWDVGTGLSTGKRKKSTAIILELFDLAATVGLIWYFWHDAGTMTLLLAGAGCFFALLPDFLEAPRNFLKWEPNWLKPINNLHGMFHHSTPMVWFGLVPQILTIGMVFWLK